MDEFMNDVTLEAGTDISAEIQPEVSEPQTEEVVETVATPDGGEATPTPTVFNIDGEEYTAEQIKEWKQGNLRQSDYTRKTQEIAKQREELKDAVEVYQYLTANPHLVEAMKAVEKNPNSAIATAAPSVEKQMIRDIMYKQRALETELKVADLKQKYGEFDEVALFQKATELKTDDLEFVLNGLRAQTRTVNEDELIEKAKAQLKAEIEANKNKVGTVVNGGNNQQIQKPTSLTAEQRRVAANMGLTDDEYAKWL